MLCVLLLFLIGGSVESSIEKFLIKDTTPKCCLQEEVLYLINGTFDCGLDFKKSTFVLTQVDNSSTYPCIDELVENEHRQLVKIGHTSKVEVSSTFFPKCCHPSSVYDPIVHGCTAGNDTLYKSLGEEMLSYLPGGYFHVKMGLSDCKGVIVDYEINDVHSFDGQNGFVSRVFNKTVSYGSYCLDNTASENLIIRVCHENFDACKKSESDEKLKCVRKCCADGYSYIGGGQCKFDFQHGVDFGNDSKIQNLDEPFALIPGIDCRKYIVDESWKYSLDGMGNLKLDLPEDKSVHAPFEDSYCFEHVDLGVINGRRLFLCFPYKDSNRIEFQVTRIALLFSAFFLALTLLGYILLPEMQNLHGKTLMCHCGSLLLAFVFLAVLQFHPTIDGAACKASGYIIMYLFLSAFMWSNIMCFDIWWTFGSMRVSGINQKQSERRRLMWYCIYSWSIPLVITMVTYSVQHFKDSLPDALAPIIPNLGTYNCFFEQRTNIGAFLVWFTLPTSLIILCNLVLYIKTTIYCYKVKGEIEKMKDSQVSKNERRRAVSADTEKMKMVVKLFLVMGIPWLFESISICAIPVPATGAVQVIQLFFDVLNCLQGVFIFCIFILKVKFFHALRKKLGWRPMRRSSQSVTSGLTTTTLTKV